MSVEEKIMRMQNPYEIISDKNKRGLEVYEKEQSSDMNVPVL